METIAYDKTYQEAWDSTVNASANGTFLLRRGYMDYHADRFRDASLLFRNAKGRIVGLLPANIVRRPESEGGTLVQSHGGLTYGGLIVPPTVTAPQVGEMLADAARWYATREGARRLTYKPIPYIYHSWPAQADLYWLFRMGARRTACGLSSAIDIDHRLPMATLRRRQIRKAEAAGLTLHEAESDAECAEAWQILEEVLRERHATRPTHTLSEFLLLRERFPRDIHLYMARHEGEAVAMCVSYETPLVAHMQYLASSPEGRRLGALDLLIESVIIYAGDMDLRYLDFGISTESGGSVLNEGLVAQKEGFGGRAVCYDSYTLDLDPR